MQGIEVGQGRSDAVRFRSRCWGEISCETAAFELWAVDGASDRDASASANHWQFTADTKSTGLQCLATPVDDTAEPAVVAEGTFAARVHGSGRSRLMQEVAVCPSSEYRAAVLVLVHDKQGKQDAAMPANVAAELELEELDVGGT